MDNPSLRKSAAQLIFLLGIALLMVFCTCYLPLLGTVVICGWSVPVIVAVQKNGIVAGIGIGLATSILTALFVDLGTALFVFGLMGILGVFYGIRMKQKTKNPLNSMVYGMAITVGAAVAVFGILYAFQLIDITSLTASVEESIREAFAVYSQSLDSSDLAGTGTSLKAMENEAVAFTLQVLPGLLLSSLVTVAGVNYILADYYLKNKKYKFKRLPVFREWHFPWWILWGILGALALLVFGNGMGNELFVIIAKNIFFCYAPLMLISGISFTRWIMVRWGIGRGFCAVIWILAVLFITVSMVYFIITGIADTMFDYRKSFKKIKPKEDIK